MVENNDVMQRLSWDELLKLLGKSHDALLYVMNVKDSDKYVDVAGWVLYIGAVLARPVPEVRPYNLGEWRPLTKRDPVFWKPIYSNTEEQPAEMEAFDDNPGVDSGYSTEAENAKLKEALREYVEAIDEDCISFCFGGPDKSEECEQRECKWVRVLAKAREVLGEGEGA